MTKLRTWKKCVFRFLLALAVLLAMAAAAPAEKIQDNPIPAGEAATWKLTDVRVVQPGQTTLTAEGTTTSGYAVEAEAVGNEAAPIKQGKFSLTLTATSPARNLPGQEPGFWYVRGTWTLTDVAATPEAAKARYSPAVLRGNLAADKLTFNPATDQGQVQAQVQVPMYRTKTSVSKGTGAFQGNEKFAGKLTLRMEERMKIPERRKKP